MPFGASGGARATNVADAIAKMLEEGGLTNVWTIAPSALDCAEPIVVLQGAFCREARLGDEERGTIGVTVLVVREDGQEAEAVAEECEHALHLIGWEPWAACGRYRICGMDTEAPRLRGRDGSGRWVWEFEVTCTVVRSL